ncbi:hypothetical protein PEC301937_39680 [Pectobacterium carotovorum subsp. carotovorum]|nr:hypothetical protein PEC301937_39680 [Pectobacterium carotovorum subsp. carotovorum]
MLGFFLFKWRQGFWWSVLLNRKNTIVLGVLLRNYK